MSIYSDVKEIYNDIKKDKIMIWIFRIALAILLIVFAISSISFCSGWVSGKHEKMFGGILEVNPPETITKYDTIKETVYKKDTVYIHDKSAKKTFQNKIDKVGTLNQN